MISQKVNFTKSKGKNKSFAKQTGDSFLEALRDLGGQVGDSLLNDVVVGDLETAVEQITGTNLKEIKPNEVVDFGKMETQPKEDKEDLVQLRNFLPDIVKQENQVFIRAEIEVKQQIQAIRQELKNLAVSIKGLNQEIEVAVAENVPTPGVYHLNFFERLRSTIKALRERIEESTTWLAAFNRKTGRRYWNQFKKHGSSFSLHNERAVATQTG